MRRYRIGHVDILEIQSELTIKNDNQFSEKMRQFLETSQTCLILYLNEVLYLNSSSLGVIANTAVEAKKRDKELILAGVKPPIDDIFQIVSFQTFMKLFLTLKQALDYFNDK